MIKWKECVGWLRIPVLTQAVWSWISYSTSQSFRFIFYKNRSNSLFWQGYWASQMVQWWRICLPMQKMQEMQVWFLNREDPLEEETATHSSTVARKTPRTEESGWWDTVSPWGHKESDMTEHARIIVQGKWNKHEMKSFESSYPTENVHSIGENSIRTEAKTDFCDDMFRISGKTGHQRSQGTMSRISLLAEKEGRMKSGLQGLTSLLASQCGCTGRKHGVLAAWVCFGNILKIVPLFWSTCPTLVSSLASSLHSFLLSLFFPTCVRSQLVLLNLNFLLWKVCNEYFKDLNIRPDTTKLLEENIGRTSWHKSQQHHFWSTSLD